MLWFLITALVISTFWMIMGIIFYILPLFFGAPYEGTADKKIKDIIKLSGAKKEDIIADLGSGDGRIIIAFGKKGIEAHGYEINPILVLFTKHRIKKLKLKNTFVHWKSFWKSDFGKYDIITMFQYKTLMKGLENKINKDAKRKIKVISYHWKFPDMKIKKSIGDVYLYEFDSQKNIE
jgi:hypothetical protein